MHLETNVDKSKIVTPVLKAIILTALIVGGVMFAWQSLILDHQQEDFENSIRKLQLQIDMMSSRN